MELGSIWGLEETDSWKKAEAKNLNTLNITASGSSVGRKFNDAHKNCRRSGYAGPILISKSMALWDNFCQIKMRIVKIRRKWVEQKAIFDYKNNANQTALVGFRVWI